MTVLYIIFHLILILSISEAAGSLVVDLNEKIGDYRVRVIEDDFRIFCFSGESKAVGNVWRTVNFKIHCSTESQCKLYTGCDENAVESAYQSTMESWSVYWYPSLWPTDSVRLQLFNRSCVGVSAKSDYHVRLDIKRFNFWRIAQMSIGLILFFLSPNLSRNTFLHYLTGVSLGLTGSIVILLLVLSKMVPKKSAGAIGLLIGGWATVLYVLQLIWSRIQIILNSYFNFVIAYAVIVGFLSFAICYRYGPVNNPRTLNLIQWTTQILALILIFLSSDNQEFSMTVVLLALSIYNFPNMWLRAIKSYWRRKFPPRPRLLTEEEYREQATRETEKSLKELRNYCRSPECKSWTIVSRLGSPMRFASFVEGESHLRDNEILDYETSECYTNIYTSDSDDST